MQLLSELLGVFFYILFNLVLCVFMNSLTIYMVLINLRIFFTWLPNINMYGQPFSTLCKITDPYLRLFRGIIPELFSFDFSPLLGIIVITFLQDALNSMIKIMGT